MADQPAREDAHDDQSHSGNGPMQWTWTYRGFHATHRRNRIFRIRPWRSISMPAFTAICAFAPAAKFRSMTSSAWRSGGRDKVVFDFDDPMGESTCVACGECVQACPTGALMPATIVDATAPRQPRSRIARSRASARIAASAARLPIKIKDEKVAFVEGVGPANENRLCVKGRFGFDYIITRSV